MVERFADLGIADSIVEVGTPLSAYAGQWSNGDSPGFGIDIGAGAKGVQARFYLLDSTGSPTWYHIGECSLEAGRCDTALIRPTVDDARAAHVSGRIHLTFEGDNNATATILYDLGDQSGTIKLSRAHFGRGRFEPDINYSGVWLSAGGSQVSLMVSQQYDALVGTAYAFRSDGKPVWYAMTPCSIEQFVCASDLQRMRTSDQRPDYGVTAIVGMMTLWFTGPDQANADYSVDDVQTRISIQRDR